MGLTVVGLGMAWLHAELGLTLTRNLIFEVLLPPLLFEGALSLPRQALKRALALALSLPPDMPRRDAIVVAAFGVVAFSVMVQAITMPLLLRRLKLTS